VPGVSHIGRLETTTEADFDRVFRVNVKGVFNTMQAALPKMQANGGGVILNLASVAATVGIADRFAYSMTKGAVLSMTLSVARDYLDQGIRCNCISPGRVHTPFVDDFLREELPGPGTGNVRKAFQAQPIGRMGTPAEMASLALVPLLRRGGLRDGYRLPIDGGFTHLK
jgi:NAD(P)-dependent dehydrogenase (short-subunit alcohol dehydrogenase family)